MLRAVIFLFLGRERREGDVWTKAVEEEEERDEKVEVEMEGDGTNFLFLVLCRKPRALRGDVWLERATKWKQSEANK